MPVIVHSENEHPFLPSSGSPTAILQDDADHQDIRPLEIAIINLMADKKTTEKQLATWLGATPLQVNLTFVATDPYVNAVRAGRQTTNTEPEHILNFYNAWSDIKDRKFDGMIVTGVNALQPRVDQEAFWPDVQKIFEWSKTNVFSSLFLCWGGKAALKHFHNIDSHKGDEKLWGVFPHHSPSDKTGLLFGFADVFSLPVSRWKSPSRQDIERCSSLEIIADSSEAGPSLLVESEQRLSADNKTHAFPRRVYVLGHPEYETETLRKEYERDQATHPGACVPAHYFPNDDVTQTPLNSWRPTAHLYTNWVHAIYEATPFDLAQIPSPHRANARYELNVLPAKTLG